MSNGSATADPPRGASPFSGRYAPRSRLERSVNSQPGLPLNWGSSSVCASWAARSRRSARNSSPAGAALANRALHLQLDQPVHLHRVLHLELLGDRLDEAVDDQLRSLVLGNPVRHQVEELILAHLLGGRLVADVDVVLADPEPRLRV